MEVTERDIIFLFFFLFVLDEEEFSSRISGEFVLEGLEDTGEEVAIKEDFSMSDIPWGLVMSSFLFVIFSLGVKGSFLMVS